MYKKWFAWGDNNHTVEKLSSVKKIDKISLSFNSIINCIYIKYKDGKTDKLLYDDKNQALTIYTIVFDIANIKL